MEVFCFLDLFDLSIILVLLLSDFIFLIVFADNLLPIEKEVGLILELVTLQGLWLELAIRHSQIPKLQHKDKKWPTLYKSLTVFFVERFHVLVEHSCSGHSLAARLAMS